ncbi:MAG: aldehyde dehydrogenase EutE [Planctomycetes bacterium]|nr:aldehyde dehydrogenase EutE [Planctomycetota bacterium]
MSIDENIVSRIVEKVVERLQDGKKGTESRPSADAAPLGLGDGLFDDVESAIEAARIAQEQLDAETLALRGKLIAAIRKAALENAETLAREAVEEGGLGRIDDKVKKNILAAEKTPGIEDLQSVSYTGDHGLSLMEPAPHGVIGSIIPCTNPTETLICNTIGMVAGGNAVVFNAHPLTKQVSNHCLQIFNRAIVEAGGPANLLAAVVSPTIESAQELMKHPQIKLLVVTGGGGVVKAAMSSGKKVIAAGPGNPPVVVDETADLAQAGRDIVLGASLDNNIVCILEKEIIAVDSIADKLKEAMKANGAYEINRSQTERLTKIVLDEPGGPDKHGMPNKSFVGRDAKVILKEIGLDVGDDVRLVLADVDENHPLVWTEQLMPVMPLVRVPDCDSAIDLAKCAEQGCRHTAVMHSKNIDKLSKMARVMNTSLFVKNGPSYAGLGMGGEGYCSYTIASPTGEGLTRARHFTRDRRCTLVDHFRIV